MARNDGVRYGAGGTIMEIVEPLQEPEKKKVKRKKVEMLEERIHDTLPSDTETKYGEDE